MHHSEPLCDCCNSVGWESYTNATPSRVNQVSYRESSPSTISALPHSFRFSIHRITQPPRVFSRSRDSCSRVTLSAQPAQTLAILQDVNRGTPSILCFRARMFSCIDLVHTSICLGSLVSFSLRFDFRAPVSVLLRFARKSLATDAASVRGRISVPALRETLFVAPLALKGRNT